MPVLVTKKSCWLGAKESGADIDDYALSNHAHQGAERGSAVMV